MMLQDKVVVVAGVGPGLGRAIALASAREGADVVLAARTTARLDEVAKEIAGLGRRGLAVPTDVADAGDDDHLAREQRHQPSIRAATAAWRAAIRARHRVGDTRAWR